MVKNFYKDLAEAQKAERMVYKVLSALTEDYYFIPIGDKPQYYHKGDIKAINRATGKEIFIEVKNDSRIAETRNILCEDEVFYNSSGYADGFMRYDYEIMMIHSASEQKIYVIDFETLQRHYKSGEFKLIAHED